MAHLTDILYEEYYFKKLCFFLKGVHRCDFLHLELTEPLQLAPDSSNTYVNNLRDPVTTLPAQLFHVVVFSLLLEYFPSTFQRWICCQKAHQLLMVNGLLVIITPDSHHQNRNAPMMKSWKQAIESLGFTRWRYVKLEHLHCMAFSKIQQEEQDQCLVKETGPDMLYIPQDLKDADLEETCDTLLDGMCRLDSENECLRVNFTELPQIDIKESLE